MDYSDLTLYCMLAAQCYISFSRACVFLLTKLINDWFCVQNHNQQHSRGKEWMIRKLWYQIWWRLRKMSPTKCVFEAFWTAAMCCVNNVLPAGWMWGFFCSAQCWWGHTWSAECQHWHSQGKREKDILDSISWWNTRWWWCISSTAKDWELSLVQRRFGGVSLIWITAWREGAKKLEPDSFLWCPQAGQSPWTHTATHKTLSAHQKTLPLWAGLSPGIGCPGRLWCLHRCRYPKLSGRGLGKLAVGSAWAWGLDEMIFSASLQHQPPCWFCDSMILWFYDTVFMQNHPPLWRKYSNQIWVTWNASFKKWHVQLKVNIWRKDIKSCCPYEVNF